MFVTARIREADTDPEAAKRVRPWRQIAQTIAGIQARLLLVVFYFVVLAPFALVLRRASDPLAIKPGTPKGWLLRRIADDASLERARRQF